MSELFVPGRGDPVLTDLLARWRRRRGWAALSAMVTGGAGVVLASASVVVPILHRHDTQTLSLAAAGAIYVLGCLLYATGAASRSTHGFPRWLLLALLAGSLLIATLIIAGAVSEFLDGPSGGSGSDTSTARAGSSPAPRTLAGALLDPGAVQQLLGAPVQGPRPIGRVLLRSRSVALWRGPTPDPTPHPAAPTPTLTITISQSGKHNQRASPTPWTPLPDVGPGALISHHTPSTGTVTTVQGNTRNWTLTISIRRPGPAPHPDPALTDTALTETLKQALTRLDTADHAS